MPQNFEKRSPISLIPLTTILVTRLSSWFGIHGTALNWFRSYLSSRCFRVKCNNDFSSTYLPLSFTFIYTCIFFSWQINSAAAVVSLKAQFLARSLLFVMYTTPLPFHSNYGPILYHFLHAARYWSKIAISEPIYILCCR